MHTNKYHLKSFNEIQKQKRFIFAQQIRKRDRNKKMHQMRVQLSIRQHVSNILQKQQIDTFALLNFMKNVQINQSNAVAELAFWLKTQKAKVKIQNCIDQIHWANLLSSVISYKHQYIKFIMVQYFPIIANFSMQTLNFQPIFIFLSVVVKNMQKTKLPQCQQLQISQIIIKSSQIALQKLPYYQMGVEQLKFYTYCYKNYFKIIYYLTQNEQFLMKLAKTLQQHLQKTNLISNAVKLLNILIFYDQQQQINIHGVSSKFIEFGILDNINFLLIFLDPSQFSNILINIIFALQNIMLNVGIQAIFQHHLIMPIVSLFTTEEYPIKLRVQASKFYMDIISYVKCNSLQLKQIRNKSDEYDETDQKRDPITLICYSIQKLAQADSGILQNIFNALFNLLQIGSQQKLDVNPYLLRLSYQPNFYILNQIEEFQEMINQFKEKQGK